MLSRTAPRGEPGGPHQEPRLRDATEWRADSRLEMAWVALCLKCYYSCTGVRAPVWTPASGTQPGSPEHMPLVLASRTPGSAGRGGGVGASVSHGCPAVTHIPGVWCALTTSTHVTGGWVGRQHVGAVDWWWRPKHMAHVPHGKQQHAPQGQPGRRRSPRALSGPGARGWGGFAVGFGTDTQRPPPRHWSVLGLRRA